MHPRIAQLQYLLGGEVHRFQNICAEGLNGGLYLFIYLFIYCFLRPRGSSEGSLYNFKSDHDRQLKITQNNVPGACGNVLTIFNIEA